MWQLADYSASIALPPLSAQVNTLEPWQGLLQPSWLGTSLSASISVLQVDVRELVAPNRLPLEVYARGNDLVATYAPSEGRNIQTQIYWRATQPNCGGRAAGVELILSAQTHLLDSRPGLSTHSTLPLGELFRLSQDATRLEPFAFQGAARAEFTSSDGAALFLFRPYGCAFTYAEMVHPADFSGACLEMRGENSLRLTNHLFPERLEKGVIRRGRLCGLFLGRDHDLSCALGAYRLFLEEPLPLTT